MYQETDLQSIRQQMHRRILIWLIPEAALLALVVYSFILRIEWLTSLLFALLLAVILFSVTLFILPVRRYLHFVMNALHGRNRVDTAAFDTVDAETVVREGVRCHPITMRADTIKEELDERSYYWDANLPLPDWQKGEYIRLRSHEKMVTGWQRVTGDEQRAL